MKPVKLGFFLPLIFKQIFLFSLFTCGAVANAKLLQYRQSCDTQCSSLESVIGCSNSSCLCPILNSAGSTTISSCATCLETITEVSMLASFLPLLGQACSTCSTPCSTLLTEILVQIPSCLTSVSSCACAIIKTLNPADIASCTTCVQAVDPTDLSGLMGFESQCNITISSNTSSQTTSSSAQSMTVALSTLSATGSATPKPSGGVGGGQSSASSTVAVSTSNAPHSLSTLYGLSFVWMMVLVVSWSLI
jgi:hypothetical protein